MSPDDLHREAIHRALSPNDQLSISAITLAEALVYSAKSGNLKKHHEAIMALNLSVVDVTSEIAIMAAEIRSKTSIKVPDAIISATATLARAQLWTFDSAFAKAHKGAILLK